MNQYIAVFKSLSYAGRVKNEIIYPKRPKLIKTPGAISGGCSYSLVFPKDQLDFMMKAIRRHKKGFLGIYQETANHRYEVIKDDLS